MGRHCTSTCAIRQACNEVLRKGGSQLIAKFGIALMQKGGNLQAGDTSRRLVAA